MSDYQNTVPLDLFLATMTARMEGYGNVVTPECRAIWQQMADTFNTKIANHGSPSNRTWKCLTPPTGTGKTTGLAVYCSLLSKVQSKVGVLIVCRQIKQVDELARTINELSGQKLAWADHSEHRLTDNERFNAQVLVTTHAAYQIALERATCRSSEYLDILTYWTKGARKLTVIDEALDVVTQHQVEIDDVYFAHGVLPEQVRHQFLEDAEVLLMVGRMMTALVKSEEENAKQGIPSPIKMMNKLFDATPELIDGVNFDALKSSLRGHHNAHKWELPKEHLNRICVTLDGVASMINQWTYRHRAGDHSTLNSATNIIPPDLGDGPAVLDATAGVNHVYKLYGQEAEIIPPSVKARSYRNVTLHVCRKYAGVGKYGMKAKASMRTNNLLKHLSENLPHSSKVFVCAQKEVEKEFVGEEKPFKAFETAHFGATDGLNEWSDFDACVIFGLPHKPDTWSLNNLLAFGNDKTDDYLNSDECKEWKKALKQSSLATDCIQIMNRVRCRRLVDIKGNCEPTDIFILIQSGKDGDELLRGLQNGMPDVVVVDWDICLDDEMAKRPKITGYEERLMAFIQEIGIGCEVSASEFRKVSGISPSQWNRMLIDLKDEASELTARLQMIGIRFYDNGKIKKANRKFFIRDGITSKAA